MTTCGSVGFCVSPHAIPISRFSGTATAPPPTKPPNKIALGGFCIKAVCDILDADDRLIGNIRGYDTRGDIADRVIQACEWRKNGTKGQRCGEVQLTMLPTRQDLQCTGEIFFEKDGTVKKLADIYHY